MKNTTVLVILDGWGYNKENKHNAINNAQKPNWDKLWNTSNTTLIEASGLMVGLPKGQMGNSEVGHMNIGSGRLVHQDFTRINNAILDKSFFNNNILNKVLNNCITKNKNLHIMGLLSPGGIHSHENHIKELIKYSAKQGVKKIYLHAFLDGRDTPPRSAKNSIITIDNLLSSLNIGYITSISGRYFAMDRDNNWDRIKPVYNAIVTGQAKFIAKDAESALHMAYLRNETDEFVQPTVIKKINDNPEVQNNDSIIFMNFRSDRARHISESLSKEHFNHFIRSKKPKINLVTLTQYSEDINSLVIFPPQIFTNTLGEVCEKNKLHQLRIAETEKYAHVTFFFNGGKETPFKNEDRILIPSPNVSTYDLKPEMSAYELTKHLLNAIFSKKYDLIICNYANSDMVGHTGNYNATIKAIEVLDDCLGKVSQSVKDIQGNLFITSDHGNADQMINPNTGKIHKSHTIFPVPFIYQGNKLAKVIKNNGKLSDIAPTILSLMNIDQPIEMTGNSLFEFSEK